jgi:hypothetical protein
VPLLALVPIDVQRESSGPVHDAELQAMGPDSRQRVYSVRCIQRSGFEFLRCRGLFKGIFDNPRAATVKRGMQGKRQAFCGLQSLLAQHLNAGCDHGTVEGRSRAGGERATKAGQQDRVWVKTGPPSGDRARLCHSSGECG